MNWLYHLYSKEFELFVLIFGAHVEVYYSYHKLNRKVELKERKILEILKNYF